MLPVPDRCCRYCPRLRISKVPIRQHHAGARLLVQTLSAGRMNATSTRLRVQTALSFRHMQKRQQCLEANTAPVQGSDLSDPEHNSEYYYFYLPTMSRVSRAMTSSSLVGMTKTLTLLSGVEIMISSPRLEFASSSISTPR